MNAPYPDSPLLDANKADGCTEYRELTRRGLLGSFTALAAGWIPTVNYTEDMAPLPNTTSVPRDIIVTVFLRGGADGLAVCAPWKDNSYSSFRHATQIYAPTSADPFRKAIDLDGFFGWPQAMSPLADLYKAKNVLMTHQTGSTNPTRSHFDAQQFMEAGKDDKYLWTGWMGRHLASVSASKTTAILRAVALSGQMPLILESAPKVGAISDFINFGLAGNSGTVNKRLDWLANAYATSDAPLAAAAGNARKTLDVLQKINYAGYTPAAGATYNPPITSTLKNGSTVTTQMPWFVTDFGESLKATAAILKADVGVEAVHLDFGGWDTHNYEQPFEWRDDQGNPQFGTLFFNLRSLSANLNAFFRDLDAVKLTGGKTMMDRVTVVVMSEFGRTVNENGVQGTDHGQGGVMLFMGKNVNGGRVDRVWQPLNGAGVDAFGGLAVSLDYRIFVGELLEKRLQNGAQLAAILPGYKKPTTGWRGAFK